MFGRSRTHFVMRKLAKGKVMLKQNKKIIPSVVDSIYLRAIYSGQWIFFRYVGAIVAVFWF